MPALARSRTVRVLFWRAVGCGLVAVALVGVGYTFSTAQWSATTPSVHGYRLWGYWQAPLTSQDAAHYVMFWLPALVSVLTVVALFARRRGSALRTLCVLVALAAAVVTGVHVAQGGRTVSIAPLGLVPEVLLVVACLVSYASLRILDSSGVAR